MRDVTIDVDTAVVDVCSDYRERSMSSECMQGTANRLQIYNIFLFQTIKKKSVALIINVDLYLFAPTGTYSICGEQFYMPW